MCLPFLPIWQGNAARRQLTIGVLVAIVAVRLTRCVADFLFAPESAAGALIPFDQAGARYFRDAAVRIAIVGAAFMITAYLIGIWSGDLYVRFALMIIAASVFVAYFAVAIWRGRHHAVRAFLSAGGRPGSALGHAPAGPILGRAHHCLCRRNVSCDRLAALAGASVSAVSFLGAVLVVVVGIPVADCLVGLLMSRRGRAAASGSEAPRPENRVFRRASRIVILVLAMLLVLQPARVRPRRQCSRQARRVDRHAWCSTSAWSCSSPTSFGNSPSPPSTESSWRKRPSMLTAQST